MTHDECRRQRLKTLRLYASGQSSNKVAKQLGVGQSTVMSRLRRMRSEYGATTVQELCEKLDIEFRVKDRYELTRRKELNDRERAVLQLLKEGYDAGELKQKLSITHQQYVYAVKRLKLYYGVSRQKQLLAVK